MSAADDTVRKRVRYEGRVQGVGFRYVTQRLAERFAVGGWVKNMPDGAVALEVEGARGECEGLLDAIAEHFRSHIHERTTQEISPTGAATGFEIRY